MGENCVHVGKRPAQVLSLVSEIDGTVANAVRLLQFEDIVVQVAGYSNYHVERLEKTIQFLSGRLDGCVA